MKKIVNCIVFLLSLMVFESCISFLLGPNPLYTEDTLKDITIEIPKEYESIPYYYKIEFTENGAKHVHTRREAPHPEKVYSPPRFIIRKDTLFFDWGLNHVNPTGTSIPNRTDNIYEPVNYINFGSAIGFFVEGQEYKASFKNDRGVMSEKCVCSIKRGQDEVAYSISFDSYVVHTTYAPGNPAAQSSTDTTFYKGRIDFSKKMVAWIDSYDKQKGTDTNYKEEYIQSEGSKN
ncbi:MAG: hypothetical protein J5640_09155 [Bacteroidales bacterium]|nr:hypothetical protein [Bacteroidales bacterium]